jgi:hypothetical protein
MSSDSPTSEAKAKRLNDLVAVTIVIFTVFMAICKVKDDNINQAMQKAQAETIDAWSEYQASRVKLHVDQVGLSILKLLEPGTSRDKDLAVAQARDYEANIKKYQSRSEETQLKAKNAASLYDQLNFHDDQFDFSEAFISIAIAVAAVATLTSHYWLLYFAWGSGSIGIVFGLSGFLGLNLHSDLLAKILGT